VLLRRSGQDNGGLAQLGEHLLCKQGVVGSIPSSSTITYRVSRTDPMAWFRLIGSSFKTKVAWQEIAQAVFVLIDIDRLTSVERHTAVL
jgi:hypothetical protein